MILLAKICDTNTLSMVKDKSVLSLFQTLLRGIIFFSYLCCNGIVLCNHYCTIKDFKNPEFKFRLFE